MDFIAIDLDETWKAFQQPKSTYVEAYVPPKVLVNDFVKLVQVDPCGPLPDCTVEGDQDPQRPGGPAGKWGGSSLGDDGIGDGAQTEAEGPALGDDDSGDMEQQKCQFEQGLENDRDTAAREAAEEIIAEPTFDIFEHVVGIIRSDDGTVRTVGPFTGTASNPQGSPTSVSIGGILNSLGEGDTLIGLVHNHPNSNSDSPISGTDLTGPGPTDWTVARDHVRGGRRHVGDGVFESFPAIANGNDYALYIIDSEGNLAEFDYSNYIDENGLFRDRVDDPSRAIGRAADSNFEADDENRRDAMSKCQQGISQ